MQKTTKIELWLRLVGVIGVLLVFYGTWYPPGGSLSRMLACLGLIMVFLAIISVFGLGPIGKRLRNLYAEEKKERREKYKRAPQPWETKY